MSGLGEEITELGQIPYEFVLNEAIWRKSERENYVQMISNAYKSVDPKIGTPKPTC